jgi:hypothetical protein
MMKDYCLTCGTEVYYDGNRYRCPKGCDNSPAKLLCPYCHNGCEMALNPNGGSKPRPGSVMLCNECGEWCRFTETLGLEKIDDINEIEPDTFNQMARLSTAMRMAKSKVVLVEVKPGELNDFFDWLRKI